MQEHLNKFKLFDFEEEPVRQSLFDFELQVESEKIQLPNHREEVPLTPSSDKRYALFRRIVELSEANDWNRAKKEWVLKDVFESDEPGTCLCGHFPIKEFCVLSNWRTGNETIVGNHCVRHFLGFDDVGRIMDAIKEHRINADLIKHVYGRGIISSWERGFLLSTWRKRKLTAKQAKIYSRLRYKIFDELTKRRRC